MFVVIINIEQKPPNVQKVQVSDTTKAEIFTNADTAKKTLLTTNGL